MGVCLHKNRLLPSTHYKRFFLISCVCVLISCISYGQTTPGKLTASKNISPYLFGLFFEDINYSADGGLYAEMVQNRSFEYSPTDRREWHPFSFWQYITPGFSYGNVNVETTAPIHANNPHYLVLNIEHTGDTGIGIRNSGFDKMPIVKGAKYHFSLFARNITTNPISLWISLQNSSGQVLAETTFSTVSPTWKKYSAELQATASHDSAQLVIIATSKGKLALDMISLFPDNTFKNRTNGLRTDLAQLLADMKPSFIRFPGGCLTHGDGLGNMYRWKNTVGPLEQRLEQKNIWGYHQSMGLGFFEYFQFCEDIGAKPLPILPAAVSCQNSGGTWRIGGTGQKAIPMEEMGNYVQEVLDLIEWANGPAGSTWGTVRAAAGHPEPFHLEFIGIGNEDKMTPEFESRFKMIYDAVKKKHPDITVIGTVGPFSQGEDFDKGWKIARELQVPVVDEHYYKQPEWFISNHYRYDGYNRKNSRVYVGEYASWGNKMKNALSEAAYMIGLERNGDVVSMASYAPLLAKKGFTQWNPNMIYFDNINTFPTVNYYVQKMFSTNQGDRYFEHVINRNTRDSAVAASCVQDSKTGDIILKLLNAGAEQKTIHINLAGFRKWVPQAARTELSGLPDAANTFTHPKQVLPVHTDFIVKKSFDYSLLPMSLTVIRIKTNK